MSPETLGLLRKDERDKGPCSLKHRELEVTPAHLSNWPPGGSPYVNWCLDDSKASPAQQQSQEMKDAHALRVLAPGLDPEGADAER